MCRLTTLEREELKKRDKELKKMKEEEDLGRPVVWIKYPLGLKHQVVTFTQRSNINKKIHKHALYICKVAK